MTENATFQTRKTRLRLTDAEKDALIEAAYRWNLQMQGYEYDRKPLESALEKLEGSRYG